MSDSHNITNLCNKESTEFDQEVAQTLIVDGIDDEGYIKLHSSRRIRHTICEQLFYKIHAEQVNKIIEMASAYRKNGGE